MIYLILQILLINTGKSDGAVAKNSNPANAAKSGKKSKAAKNKGKTADIVESHAPVGTDDFTGADDVNSTQDTNNWIVAGKRNSKEKRNQMKSDMTGTNSPSPNGKTPPKNQPSDVQQKKTSSASINNFTRNKKNGIPISNNLTDGCAIPIVSINSTINVDFEHMNREIEHNSMLVKQGIEELGRLMGTPSVQETCTVTDEENNLKLKTPYECIKPQESNPLQEKPTETTSFADVASGKAKKRGNSMPKNKRLLKDNGNIESPLFKLNSNPSDQCFDMNSFSNQLSLNPQNKDSLSSFRSQKSKKKVGKPEDQYCKGESIVRIDQELQGNSTLKGFSFFDAGPSEMIEGGINTGGMNGGMNGGMKKKGINIKELNTDEQASSTHGQEEEYYPYQTPIASDGAPHNLNQNPSYPDDRVVSNAPRMLTSQIVYPGDPLPMHGEHAENYHSQYYPHDFRPDLPPPNYIQSCGDPEDIYEVESPQDQDPPLYPPQYIGPNTMHGAYQERFPYPPPPMASNHQQPGNAHVEYDSYDNYPTVNGYGYVPDYNSPYNNHNQQYINPMYGFMPSTGRITVRKVTRSFVVDAGSRQGYANQTVETVEVNYG